MSGAVAGRHIALRRQNRKVAIFQLAGEFIFLRGWFGLDVSPTALQPRAFGIDMNIYTVTAIEKPDAAAQAIARVFPGDFMPVTNDMWLVAGIGTAQEICGKLGLPVGPGAAEPAFTAVVTGVNGYFGYAPSNVWEWVSTKQVQSRPTSEFSVGQVGGV